MNLTDQDPGVFYVEVKDHKINIEPYDYHDRNCAVTISGDDFVKLANGKLDPVKAFTLGKLKVDGDNVTVGSGQQASGDAGRLYKGMSGMILGCMSG